MPDATAYEELSVLAWRAVDAWMIHADRLDEAMDDLRDYIKGKPEAVALARQFVEAERSEDNCHERSQAG